MSYPIDGQGEYYWMSDDEYTEFMAHVDELVEIQQQTGITFPLHSNIDEIRAYLKKVSDDEQPNNT